MVTGSSRPYLRASLSTQRRLEALERGDDRLLPAVAVAIAASTFGRIEPSARSGRSASACSAVSSRIFLGGACRSASRRHVGEDHEPFGSKLGGENRRRAILVDHGVHAVETTAAAHDRDAAAAARDRHGAGGDQGADLVGSTISSGVGGPAASRDRPPRRPASRAPLRAPACLAE